MCKQIIISNNFAYIIAFSPQSTLFMNSLFQIIKLICSQGHLIGLYQFDNNFTMNRKEAIKIYINLQGKLEKKSTNYFIGYQAKIWKVLQNGTKIGYKNDGEDSFQPNKIFNITDVFTEEVESQEQFLLHTPNRIYELKAEDIFKRKQWMRAIAFLRKEIKKKQKNEESVKKINHNFMKKTANDSTLPSIRPQIGIIQGRQTLTQTMPGRFTSNNISLSKISSEHITSQSIIEDQLKQKYHDLLKKLSPNYINYHVFIVRLKTKGKDLFLANSASHYYIMFSSKSLMPEEYISEQNLDSSQLPHWAEVDGFYKLSDDNKLIFQLGDIQSLTEADTHSSLLVTTSRDKHEFFCDSLILRKKLKQMLQIGKVNAIQSKTQGYTFKKNYDILILLHSSNLEDFNAKVGQLINPFKPTGHTYQPEVIKKLIDNLSPLIVEVLTVLQNKVKTSTDTIVDFLRIIHDQVREKLKLVWDTSHQTVKGGDILNILKSISKYESLVNKYVKDRQLQDAMKQLSKLYMRVCYKNFEKIIIGLVQQQKKNNFYLIEQQNDQPYLQTHAITDLFKFIYDVFELAIPCWNSRLHLHNINRLIRRALSVFVAQLKAVVDEEDIGTQQLIGICNNYVRFNEQVEQFYDSKLIELKQQTKESYDQLKNDYREISMVIIDKLVLPLKIQLKIFFQKQLFYSVNMQEVYKIILNSSIYKQINKSHFIFKKRYYQRIFASVRQEIGKILQKQAKKVTKKKPDLNKILQKIQQIKKDCLEMCSLIAKSKLKLQREFTELRTILTTNRRQEIKTILIQSNELYKRIYKWILIFRSDYNEDSQLFNYVKSLENDLNFKDSPKMSTKQLTNRISFSKYYIQQFDRNSVSESADKQKEKQIPVSEEKKIMISEGHVKRQKNHNYEDIYLKLKKSILYIYENERMERCQNTIQIEDILNLVPTQAKPSFIINFQTLSRPKEMKIKCSSIEERDRWTYSILLEKKRLENDKKIKGIKIKVKKSNLIIDYFQLNNQDYWTYNL